MKHYVYVSLSAEDRIAILTLDSQTGKLEAIGESRITGGPAPLTVDPNRDILFAGLRSSCHIASFVIDRNTGSLTFGGKTALKSDPCFLGTDRTGRFLFSTYYAAGAVAVHSIDSEGMLQDSPVEWIQTAKNAHSMQTDPTNAYALVPHTGPNTIFQFKFDSKSGHLTPTDSPRFYPDEGQGPRHFCFHPNRKFVYFVNEQGCSICAYRFDSATGDLSPLQSVSTLPDEYSGDNTCAQIHMTPQGGRLFASNRGHDSIASFTIDPASGGLTPIGQTPTEKTPRAFNLDPRGWFLLSTGLDSGNLSVYRIDPRSGTLIPLYTHAVGERPMWVLVL